MAFMTFADGNILTATQMNTYLMKQAVIVCTSGTRPASPPEGMLIYETDTKLFRMYNGSGWKRHSIDAETWQPVQVTESSTISSISSTSFAAGSPVCGTAFNAPPSGRVKITVSGYVTQSNTTYETRLSFEIRNGSSVGSGTVVTAASDNLVIVAGRAVNDSAAAVVSASFGPYLITGLTAAADYNTRTLHRVTGGSGSVTFRHLLVEPVI